MQTGRIAVANEDEGARTGQQHVGKVLAAHHRVEIARSTCVPRRRWFALRGKGVGGFLAVIDRDRIVAVRRTTVTLAP